MRRSRRRTGLVGLAATLLLGGLPAGLPGGLLGGLAGTSASATTAADPVPASGPEPARVAGPDTERGSWTVTPAGPGSFRVTWRSPRPLPVTDARPEVLLAGAPLPAPSVAADGRTVAALVAADRAPRITDLEVRLSGRVLDSTRQPSLRGAETPYVAPPPGRTLTTDPGTPGPYTTVTDDYELAGLDYPRFKAPIEREGHVVLPADRPAEAGPAPLVLFLHGRHDWCYGEPTGPGDDFGWPCAPGMQPVPSHRGYDYAQQLLASQGYATVSIAANGVNAQDWRAADGGAEARGLLVRSHLDQWARWVDEGRYDVDLGRVVLVGHSRGGEGVNHASTTIPLDAPYRVVGQVLLAPTAFTRTVASYVPTVTVLPYCDGDVVDLQGQAYTDRARDVTDGDTALHSSVLVMGANHNFFNTEWTPGLSQAPSFDDGRVGGPCRRRAESRLGAEEQRAVGQTWIAGAVALTAGAEHDLLPMFDGSHVAVPSAGEVDVRSHAVGLDRDLRRPGFEASVDPDAVAGAGTESRLCEGRVGIRRPGFCGHGVSAVAAPHWVQASPWTRGTPTAPAWSLRWASAGAQAWLDVAPADSGWDVGAAEALTLRTVVGKDLGPVQLRALLADGSGGEAVVELPDGGELRPFPGGEPLGKLWAQDLRLPLAGVTGVDLTDLRRVGLEGVSADGQVWVLDVAAAGTGVPAVAEQRLPLLRVDDVRVREGDGGDPTAALDFQVLGSLEREATFNVRVDDPLGRRPEVHQLVVPAGATDGVIEVPYDADTRDDLPRRTLQLAVYPVAGAMPVRWGPRLTVLDDDPAPRLTVTVRPRPVHEGQRARWVVELSEPADYYVSVVGRVVRGTGRPVSVGDVSARWLRDRIGELPAAATPLHRARPWLGEAIPPGRTRTELWVPLRVDGDPERAESLTVRVRARVGGGATLGADPVVRAARVLDR